MSSYQKPHLTFKEQLDLLKSRGLLVSDEAAALACLKSIGYYRLSGYWYPFRELIKPNSIQNKLHKPQRKDTFVPNSKFQHVVELYLFDKKLRLVLLDAIEKVEIAIRVSIAHHLGKYDSFAHINPKFLHGHFTKKIDPITKKTRYEQWLDNLQKQTKRSKEDFVQHYNDKYGSPLPIWVAIELWDFCELISSFPIITNASIENMGFPADWKKHKFCGDSNSKKLNTTVSKMETVQI